MNADDNLLSSDGQYVYIRKSDIKKDLEELNRAAQDAGSRVFGEGEITEADLDGLAKWEVTDAFYYFLESLPAWNFAEGRFEQEMAKLCG